MKYILRLCHERYPMNQYKREREKRGKGYRLSPHFEIKTPAPPKVRGSLIVCLFCI